jgi:hypothetical protein
MFGGRSIAGRIGRDAAENAGCFGGGSPQLDDM